MFTCRKIPYLTFHYWKLKAPKVLVIHGIHSQACVFYFWLLGVFLPLSSHASSVPNWTLMFQVSHGKLSHFWWTKLNSHVSSIPWKALTLQVSAFKFADLKPLLPIFEFSKIWHGMQCKEVWDATMAFGNGALSKEVVWKDWREIRAKLNVRDFFGLWMHQYTCYTSHSLMHDPKFNLWHALSRERSFLT